MVSPSKKRKDRKGRENDDKSLGLSKERISGSKKVSKPFKPFTSKRFYLDIKNSASLLKLENKLKSLGATIEQFLIKEVNYVVTDRKDSLLTENQASCSTPILSPSPLPSPGVSSPLDGLGQKKSKTRAEAMLERVRLQPQTVKIDPLDNARSWNIPIYSLQEIFIRLEKIRAKASKHNTPGLKVLKGHYIKLETGINKRPEFKLLREWPTINLNSARGESPFAPNRDGSQRITRKLSKNGTERIAGGYCEMCCTDFPDIRTHVLTPEHIKYANNPDNYAQLDSIIKSKTVNAFLASQMCASLAGNRRCLRSGSVENNTMGSRSSSLTQSNGHLPRTRATTRSLDDSCTKKPLEVQCNGVVNHNHLTRSVVKSDSVLGRELDLECEGISRRTRTISASCPATNNEYSQLSPTGSDITHHLRSRKQIWMPTSLLGTTAEDALNNSRLRPNRDYTVSEAMNSPSSGKTVVKPSDAEDSLEKKTKSNSKDEEERSQTRSPVFDCNSIDKSASQLSSDEEDDVLKKEKFVSKVSDVSKSKENLKKLSSKKKFKKKSFSTREMANLNCIDRRKKVQKKRLSVEEKLIEDNKTYYKVEVLNSKLRSTGYYITQSQRELEMSKTNGNDSCVSKNCTEPAKNELKTEEKEPVVVRFKKVRQTELSLLSDEAENFMFGEPSRRESSVSTESSEEEDDEVSLKFESEDNDKVTAKVKKEVIDESSIGSCSIASSSTSSRRKRKSPDESILQDNVEYYKFESTGSRLRFHGNLFPPTPLSDKKEVSIKSEEGSELKIENKIGNSLKVKLDESDFEPENLVDSEKLPKDDVVKHLYDDLEFSFEKVPTHEPWYQTFKRQDECKEFYFGRYTNYPTVLLPYEYPNSVLRQFRLDAIKEKSNKRKKKKKGKQSKLIADDKPRKSPRCHASTLAIMSSLMRRKPRDSPEKKPEPSTSEMLAPSEMILQDEESRCSTIIEPPSVAPSDTQMSTGQTSLQIPEIKIDTKIDSAEDMKRKTEADIKKAEEDIDQLFSQVCCENEDDVLVHMLQAIKKEIEASPTKENPKKGKGKGKSNAAKRESPLEFGDVVTCLHIDPQVLEEELIESSYSPGPIVDVMNLVETYRSCSSMERADYEHMNPHAVDALRVLIAESCNSSDCGGSSACDYSFLEDGKVCRKRKRKKRNMTGWPAVNKKKCLRKSEELSTAVLRRNCRMKEGLSSEIGLIKEVDNETCSSSNNKFEDSEVNIKLREPSEPVPENRDQCVDDSDVISESVKSDIKACSTISRTTSVDSSSIKSFDVQSCYIRVKKMSEMCVETFSRQLRSSDSSPLKNSPSRRGSSRQAKIVASESIRRYR